MQAHHTFMAGLRAAAGAGLLGLTTLASATDYVVDTTEDSIAEDGQISLREAILAANTNMPVGDAPAGDPDGDTIRFSEIDLALDSTITLTQGELTISDDLVIDGSLGLTTVTIDGASASRILTIDTSSASVGDNRSVTLRNLTLINGAAADNGGAILIPAGNEVALDTVTIDDSVAAGELADQGGGAIFNAATLSIINSSFSGNAANMGSGSGGAIYNAGNASLSISGSSFTGNSAVRAGGAIETRAGSTLELIDTLLGGNAEADGNATGPNPGNGGGLHVTGNGNVTIDGGTVANNTASAEGGGLWNGSGMMSVTGTTIDANTASGPAADNGGGGIFNNGGTLELSDVTLSNNVADGDAPEAGVAGSGGGLFSAAGGRVTITGGSITGNSAIRAGGGIEVVGDAQTTLSLTNVELSGNSTGADPGNGGALHVTGSATVTVNGGTISNNVAAREGGGLWNGAGTMTVDGSTDAVTLDGNIASGPAADDGGGALFNNGGTLIVRGATISNNIADGDAGSGGGIFSLGGSLQVTDSTLDSNRANRAGGGIETAGEHALTLTRVTLENNLAGVDPAVPAPGNGGGLHVSGTGSVDIIDSSISGNQAAAEGGGLWNQAGTTMAVTRSGLTGNDAAGSDASQGGGGLFNNGGTVNLSETVISGNSATNGAGNGGGIMNVAGDLNIQRSVIMGNMSARAGGGIEDRAVEGNTRVRLLTTTLAGNSTGGNPGNGGGLHITGELADVRLDRSTVSGNSAANEGGGLWNFSGSTLRLVNSTVSGNSADAAETGGGGLFNQPNGELQLFNVTVANNDAASRGGGLFNAASGQATAVNTILGDNTANSNNDVDGALSANFSLIESVGTASISGSGNITGEDPSLQALADNGGPTQTHALNADSPAIDAADDGVCNNSEVGGIDQRGIEREADCDIGSFERIDNPVASTRNNSPATLEVSPGDSGVPAVAFTLTNTSNETISVDGFNGSLSGTADFSQDIGNLRVFLDANGNGQVDAGDPEVPGATATLMGNAARFSVEFSPARSIPSDASESYIVTLDVSNGNVTGGSSASTKLLLLASLLPLLAFAPAGALSRRTRWAILLAAGGLLLSGCDASGGRLSGETPDKTVQLRVTDISGQGDSTGEPLSAELPVIGPLITITE